MLSIICTLHEGRCLVWPSLGIVRAKLQLPINMQVMSQNFRPNNKQFEALYDSLQASRKYCNNIYSKPRSNPYSTATTLCHELSTISHEEIRNSTVSTLSHEVIRKVTVTTSSHKANRNSTVTTLSRSNG
jgi:hypothetical protein